MGKLGTKTWSDMQSLWAGKDYQSPDQDDQHLHNSNIVSSSTFDNSNSSYQNTSTNLSNPSLQQSKSNSYLSTEAHDANFESRLDTKLSTTKEPGDKSQSVQAKPKEQPAPNLINFDDDKWGDDDDAGWESIDTK